MINSEIYFNNSWSGGKLEQCGNIFDGEVTIQQVPYFMKFQKVSYLRNHEIKEQEIEKHGN